MESNIIVSEEHFSQETVFHIKHYLFKVNWKTLEVSVKYVQNLKTPK